MCTYFDAIASNKGHATLADRRASVGQTQYNTNLDYKRGIDNGLRSLGHGPIGASVDVYRNGDFVKSVDLGGATTPVVSHSYRVSGLPSGYWPPGTITMISIDSSNKGCCIVVATYPTTGTITVHQEADITYQSSTPQALVDVEVETGDMIQFVVQARLSTDTISAPSAVGVTTDLRMTLTDTTITSTGHRDATITIEGGAIEIFCCSE